MCKYLNHVSSFQKLASWMQNVFDFAGQAEFDDEAAVLYSAQDAGVQDENLHSACTWFFPAKARLSPAKT